jgi:hypothetical protein
MVLADEVYDCQTSNYDEGEPLLQQSLPSESEHLRTPSAHEDYDAVDKFSRANNLVHKKELFEKAATLLRNKGRPEHVPDITAHEIEALQNETRRKWSQPLTLYFTIVICSIGAIEQGTAQTSMNGANLYFPKQFGIGSDSSRDKFLVGLINSGIYLSVGAL